MPRALGFAVFFGIALTILGTAHYYLWLRLVANPALPAVARRMLTGVLVLLYLGIPLTFYLARAAEPSAKKLLTLPGYVWLGSLFILFVLVLSIDVVRGLGGLVSRLVQDVPPADPERRVTVARLLAAAVAILGTGAAGYAVYSGLSRVQVKHVRARLAKLPQALDGTTIVQLSDVHIGPTIRREFLEDIVARVNALDPDVVAITGDLVDGSVRELKEHVAPLANLRARHGVYFVTGNHEYYSGMEAWCRELTRLGIRVLRNERVSIGGPDASYDLAGVDDYSAGRFGGSSDVAQALSGRDPSREVVLLAHQPRSVFEAQKHGVGLQLSGHTHGGQIFPWNYLVYLQQPVVAGLARIGETLVYVSCGTGYWGPPMRLGAPAEITRIVLGSGAAESAHLELAGSRALVKS